MKIDVTLRVKLFVLIAGVIIFATSGVTAVALWRELMSSQELHVREGVALASKIGVGIGGGLVRRSLERLVARLKMDAVAGGRAPGPKNKSRPQHGNKT